MKAFFRRLLSLVRPSKGFSASFGGEDLVAKYAHGNVKLQTGRYLTIEASKAMKERIRSYEF